MRKKSKEGFNREKAGFLNKRAAGLALALATAAALSGCAAQAQSAQAGAGNGAAGASGGSTAIGTAVGAANAAYQSSITAEGEGKVQVVPDIAEISLNVTTEGTDAGQVKDENTKKYNDVVAFLQEKGIAETSIRTEDVSLNPKYDWSSSEQQLIGYTMTTSLRVSDIPIDTLGGLLDSAVDAGINGVQSVRYLSSSYDEKYNEALKLAVENAKSKASAIAEAGGVSLGAVTGVTEHGADTSARLGNVMMSARSEAGAMESAADSMSVMPGQLEITANITASFAVQ